MKKEKMSVIVIYQKHNTVKVVCHQPSELRVNYKATTIYSTYHSNVNQYLSCLKEHDLFIPVCLAIKDINTFCFPKLLIITTINLITYYAI